MKNCYIITAFTVKNVGDTPNMIQFVAVSEKDSDTVRKAVVETIEKTGNIIKSTDVHITALSYDIVASTYKTLRNSMAVEKVEGNVIYARFRT